MGPFVESSVLLTGQFWDVHTTKYEPYDFYIGDTARLSGSTPMDYAKCTTPFNVSQFCVCWENILHKA